MLVAHLRGGQSEHGTGGARTQTNTDHGAPDGLDDARAGVRPGNHQAALAEPHQIDAPVGHHPLRPCASPVVDPQAGDQRLQAHG